MMNYITVTNPNEDDVNLVRHRLQDYNDEFWEVDTKDQYVIKLVEDDLLFGGIVFTIFGEWLEINYFWVDDSQRGRGLGVKLLNEAETFGKKIGCKTAALDTFNFQAKPFYEKNGYRVVYTKENYPIKNTRYYMEKKL